VLDIINTEDEEETGSGYHRQPVVNSFLRDHSSTNSEPEVLEDDFHDKSNDEQIDEYEMDIEDFIDRMDADDKNRKIPLYSGSPISIHEACTRLVRLIHLLNLDKSKTLTLLKELRHFFPIDCHLPKTVFRLFKITNNDRIPQVCLKLI
jgi:hypothetical protein